MHRTRHTLVVGLTAAVALALGGCSGDDGETADPSAGTTTDAADTTADDAGAGDDATSPADDAATSAPDDAEPTDDAAEPTDDEGADATDMDEGVDGADADGAEATVAVASSDLGDVVVDGEGRTLYLFVPDEGGEPTCTGDCAQVWPVFEGPAAAGDGADGSLLGTAEHPSGVTQVTYGGWPLYYFANDSAPGDVNGQGLNDVWFVVGPDGEPIRDAATG